MAMNGTEQKIFDFSDLEAPQGFDNNVSLIAD